MEDYKNQKKYSVKKKEIQKKLLLNLEKEMKEEGFKRDKKTGYFTLNELVLKPFDKKRRNHIEEKLLMNLNIYHLTKDKISLINKKSEKQLLDILLKFFLENRFRIVEIEKFFYDKENKSFGIIPIIVENNKREYILINLKINKNEEISNFDIAETQFMKSSFSNIKSVVIQINEIDLKIKTHHLGNEGRKFLNILKILKEDKNWNKIRIINY